MDRKVERILTIIGIVLNSLGVILLPLYFLFIYFVIDRDEGFTEKDVGYIGLFIIILFIVILIFVATLILSIIGLKKMGNNDKTSGILLIIAGILSGTNSIHGILFLIAGILMLAKKPNETLSHSSE